MFAIIQAAGWPIWPLLLASVIAVALIIERSFTLRAGRIVPPTLLEQVLSVYQRQGVSEEVIDRLFPGNPLLCAGKTKFEFRTQPRESWRNFLAQCSACWEHI